ncbi:MAG: hypothetical protein ACC645_25445, partial [Pirellulales bacterium]
MKPTLFLSTMLLAAVAAGAAVSASAAERDSQQTLSLHTRSRLQDGSEFRAVYKTAQWDPKKTALVVCDMWNEHW